MKISIIVPVYNNEKYIDKCIKSIINQKYTDWELILINDGSKDKSKDICERYANSDERIILVNSKNEGPSVARNKGLELATGEYCMFIDGDDYIEQDTLSVLNKEIEKDDYQIIFYGNYNDIFVDNEYVECGENRCKEYQFNNNEEFKKIYIDLFNKFLLNQVWNKLYKKSFIDEIGTRFPKGMSYSEDLIFNIKLYKNLQKGKIVNKSLYHYVNHKEGSLCSTFNVNKFNYIKYAYIKLKEETSGWYDELSDYLNNTFIKNINIYINSLYDSSCSLKYSQKKDIVEDIINDDVVQKSVSSSNIIGIRNKITAFILKNKLTKIALLMGKTTRAIRKN